MSVNLIAGQRQPNERDNHVIACNDWLNLGPGRTLPELVEKWESVGNSGNKPPTKSLGTLSNWSAKYDWPSRATEFDSQNEALKNEAIEAKRQEILNNPLAHAYGRLEALYEIFNEIQSELQAGIYTSVTKVGKDGAATTLEVLDDKAIAAFRGLLDDMAKETGGRVKKQELTGKDGAPILFVNWDDPKPLDD